MAALAHNKYTLKALHEEIDLYDRKLAHLLKYEDGSNASAGKMRAKRDLLVRTARLMASEGIEFKDSDLPRSFRTQDDVAERVAAAEVTFLPEAVPAEELLPVSPAGAQAQSRPMPSPFEGTVLDGRAGLDAYRRNRARSTTGSR